VRTAMPTQVGDVESRLNHGRCPPRISGYGFSQLGHGASLVLEQATLRHVLVPHTELFRTSNLIVSVSVSVDFTGISSRIAGHSYLRAIPGTCTQVIHIGGLISQ
jgi:hypothetical protein